MGAELLLQDVVLSVHQKQWLSTSLLDYLWFQVDTYKLAGVQMFDNQRSPHITLDNKYPSTVYSHKSCHEGIHLKSHSLQVLDQELVVMGVGLLEAVLVMVLVVQ